MVDLAHCRKLVYWLHSSLFLFWTVSFIVLTSSFSSLPSLSDESMVSELRGHLMSFSSPTPSVEALLHAHIRSKYVDHSHAGT